MGRIHSVLRDRSSSEDVLQEVMLEIWNKHAARYDPVLGRVDAWLLRLARSRAIDWGRRKSVRFAHSLDFETHDRCSLEPRMKSMDAAFLHGALKELPDHEQMPVYLSFLNGLTHEEIALHMDIPLGTVKTRIRLAIIRLRKELVPQGANP
jgi:RNA polymerase sigma-70 factor (ECF subfamily)